MTVNTVGYTYNDFGRVTADNRSGNAADISYAYDDLHGWQKSIKSAGGFEQKLYHGSSSFVDGVEDGDDEYVYAADGTRLRAVHSRVATITLTLKEHFLYFFFFENTSVFKNNVYLCINL